MRNSTLKAVVITIMLLTVQRVVANNNASELANANTAHFSISISEGWPLFNSYIAVYSSESVPAESIIQHTNNTNWSQGHYIGNMKAADLVSPREQGVAKILISPIYKLRFDTDERSYLLIDISPEPLTSSAVVPGQV